MNISVNPWSFTSTDVASSTAAASPGGMIQQGALGAVLYTATASHNLIAGQYVTYVGDTNGRFQGWYKVIAVPSPTTALLANLSSPTSGQPFNTVIAASGGGTMYVNQVQQNVRIEDISIQWTSASAPTAALINITDRNGFIEWQVEIGTTSPGLASQNRGKLMWVDGVTVQALPAGAIALLTIN